MGGKGREVLANLANEACEFYLTQLRTNHHEILKAACGVFKELITKVKGSEVALQAHFNEIVECFEHVSRHENPTVRSACFRLLEQLVMKCPQQSKSRISEMIDTGFFQVCFNFKSEEVAESVAAYLAAIYATFTAVRYRIYLNLSFLKEVHQLYVDKIKDKLVCYTRGEEYIQVPVRFSF